MESFGWKKKVQILKRNVSLIGDGDSDDENYRGPESERRNNMKSPRIQLDERKGQRLKEEGSVLAEAGKHELAIDKWRMALTYSPKDHSVYEMLAQVYMQLNELGSAVESATTATTLSPRSWENWQTLGRIQMNMGEVTLAVKSFSRAVLLCPQQRELWDEDLLWAKKLLAKYKCLNADEVEEAELNCTTNVQEPCGSSSENKSGDSDDSTNKTKIFPHNEKLYRLNQRVLENEVVMMRACSDKDNQPLDSQNVCIVSKDSP
ncbi:uncharacterized protein LOC143034358 isoform X1 [Oratosquilla oratoria]|uniref:uncharacterized protein LOC143034358 isoform X1 n=1 Tax=Oratosquilla oratoria TaxID=337810 RepID=UPI003F774FCE